MNKTDETQSLQNGHRARLRQKFMDGQLTEYEILELLLTYAIPRRDVRLLSRQLHKKYGNLYNLFAASEESLMQNKGIKEHTVTFFKLIHKLVELQYKEKLDSEPIFHNYEKLENYCKLIFAGKPIEEFHVFYLDTKYKLIEDHLHSSGTNDCAAIYIREILRRALNLNAASIVVAHNHPSGSGSFSQPDIETTLQLESVLNEFDIGLYDHLLISGDLFYSMRNMHLLDKRHSVSKPESGMIILP